MKKKSRKDSYRYKDIEMPLLLGCPRCGMSHADVTFKWLTHPIQVSKVKEYTHYSICPNTNEPILIKQKRG